MAAKKGDKRLFEADRRMELKLRLAAKRAGDAGGPETLDLAGRPDRETLDRLIVRVRQL